MNELLLAQLPSCIHSSDLGNVRLCLPVSPYTVNFSSNPYHTVESTLTECYSSVCFTQRLTQYLQWTQSH